MPAQSEEGHLSHCRDTAVGHKLSGAAQSCLPLPALRGAESAPAAVLSCQPTAEPQLSPAQCVQLSASDAAQHRLSASAAREAEFAVAPVAAPSCQQPAEEPQLTPKQCAWQASLCMLTHTHVTDS